MYIYTVLANPTYLLLNNILIIYQRNKGPRRKEGCRKRIHFILLFVVERSEKVRAARWLRRQTHTHTPTLTHTHTHSHPLHICCKSINVGRAVLTACVSGLSLSELAHEMWSGNIFLHYRRECSQPFETCARDVERQYLPPALCVPCVSVFHSQAFPNAIYIGLARTIHL